MVKTAAVAPEAADDTPDDISVPTSDSKNASS